MDMKKAELKSKFDVEDKGRNSSAEVIERRKTNKLTEGLKKTNIGRGTQHAMPV